MHALFEVWGDDQEYGLAVRQNIEELEKVLRDDDSESEQDFREAWQRMQSADLRRKPGD